MAYNTDYARDAARRAADELNRPAREADALALQNVASAAQQPSQGGTMNPPQMTLGAGVTDAIVSALSQGGYLTPDQVKDTLKRSEFRDAIAQAIAQATVADQQETLQYEKTKARAAEAREAKGAFLKAKGGLPSLSAPGLAGTKGASFFANLSRFREQRKPSAAGQASATTTTSQPTMMTAAPINDMPNPFAPATGAQANGR